MKSLPHSISERVPEESPGVSVIVDGLGVPVSVGLCHLSPCILEGKFRVMGGDQ